MNFLSRLFSPRRDPRDDVRPAWAAIVAAARQPVWYRDLGVADTVEGRFDMVSAMLALAMLRMERSPTLTPLTAPLTEIFVEEMDGQLRQSGVGDLMVGKQIGRLMSTLGGRLGAYRAGLADSGNALAEAVGRNVTLADPSRGAALADAMRQLSARMEARDDAAILAGDFA